MSNIPTAACGSSVRERGERWWPVASSSAPRSHFLRHRRPSLLKPKHPLASQLVSAHGGWLGLPVTDTAYSFITETVAALSDDPIRKWILTERNATQITRISPIRGGCINHASKYETDSGSFFVKSNRYASKTLSLLPSITQVSQL